MLLANLTKREKLIFYLTVTVILVSLLYNFVLNPLYAKWNELSRQILDKEIELRKNIRYLKQKDKVKNIYLKYADYIQNIGSDEEGMAALLNEVEKEARAQGIRIANIRPKPIKDLVFYKKFILEMHCEGTMEQYIEFIYNLQKSDQLIRVERLKIASQGQDNPLLDAQLFVTRVLAAD